MLYPDSNVHQRHKRTLSQIQTVKVRRTYRVQNQIYPYPGCCYRAATELELQLIAPPRPSTWSTATVLVIYEVVALMHPLGRPPFPSKVILHRSLALLAASFVPSGRLSNLVGGEKRLFHGPDSLARTFSSSNPAMTIKAASTFADELGKYAKQLRGEWSMEPSVALDRLVPELDGGKHKGQV